MGGRGGVADLVERYYYSCNCMYITDNGIQIFEDNPDLPGPDCGKSLFYALNNCVCLCECVNEGVKTSEKGKKKSEIESKSEKRDRETERDRERQREQKREKDVPFFFFFLEKV